MIKLSLIIPFYNMSYCIRNALNSIPNYDDLEIIIVDDNSDEKEHQMLKDICRSIKRRIYLITSKENRGAGVSRQKGIERSNGDWIMFLDADDELRPEVFDVFYDLNKTPEKLEGYDLIRYKVDWENDEDEVVDLQQTDYLLHGNMFRREFLEKTGIKFQPYLRLFEDSYFMTLCMFYTNRVLDINKCGYYMTNNKNSTTKSMTEKRNGDWLYKSIGEHLTFTRGVILDCTEDILIEKKGYIESMLQHYEAFGASMSDYERQELDRIKWYLNFGKHRGEESYDKKLSIIIPCRNSYWCINDTLEDLYKKIVMWKDYIEVILVVDDANYTDNYDYLKERYENLIVLYGTTRKYMGGNRNRGIRYAKGEFVCFLDHDDIISADGIKYFFSNDFTDYDAVIFSTTVRNPAAEYNIGICTWSIHSDLYRTSFLNQYNILFNDKIKTSEDVYMHHRVTMYLRGSNRLKEIPDITWGIWIEHKRSTYNKKYHDREYNEEFMYFCVLQTITSCIDHAGLHKDELKLILTSDFPIWINEVIVWSQNSPNFNKFNIKVMIALDIFMNEVLGIDVQDKYTPDDELSRFIKNAKYVLTREQKDRMLDILKY